MKKAVLGVIIGCIVLACIYGYSNYYDYTYDSTSPRLDLEECAEINGNHIKTSFINLINSSKSFTSFVSNLFNGLFTNTYCDDISVTDKTELEQIYADAVNYINENVSFLFRARTKSELKEIYWCFQYPETYKITFTNIDIYTYLNRFGLTSAQKQKIHDIFVQLEVWHTYNGDNYAATPEE